MASSGNSFWRCETDIGTARTLSLGLKRKCRIFMGQSTYSDCWVSYVSCSVSPAEMNTLFNIFWVTVKLPEILSDMEMDAESMQIMTDYINVFLL